MNCRCLDSLNLNTLACVFLKTRTFSYIITIPWSNSRKLIDTLLSSNVQSTYKACQLFYCCLYRSNLLYPTPSPDSRIQSNIKYCSCPLSLIGNNFLVFLCTFWQWHFWRAQTVVLLVWEIGIRIQANSETRYVCICDFLSALILHSLLCIIKCYGR